MANEIDIDPPPQGWQDTLSLERTATVTYCRTTALIADQVKPNGGHKRYTLILIREDRSWKHREDLQTSANSNKARSSSFKTPYRRKELAQDALAKVCISGESVSKMAHRGMMFRVGINLANSYFRHRIAGRSGERLRTEILGMVDVADGVAPIREALRALPHRQLFLDSSLRADLPVEMSATLNMPEGTVKTLTRRGLKAYENR